MRRWHFIFLLSAVCSFSAFGPGFSQHMSAGPTAAEEPYKAQIDALRNSLRKYEDYKVAVRDLYLSTVGCVHYSGEKIAGYMEYAEGAMGVHFVNLTVQGPPDPMKPNVLIYEPAGKELKLFAAEWLVPLSNDTQ